MDIFLPFHCNVAVRLDHAPRLFLVGRLGLQCLIIFLPNILLNSLFLGGRAFLRCLLRGHSTNAWNPSQGSAHHPTCCGIDFWNNLPRYDLRVTFFRIMSHWVATYYPRVDHLLPYYLTGIPIYDLILGF